MIMTLFENHAEVASTVAGQYRVLFENNLAAVYVSTPEGKLLNCNGAFLRMYGFESKEAALAHPTAFLYSHPTEREQFLNDLGRQGQILNYECTQRRQDGTLFWILERATIVMDGDGNSFIEGTAIDITERKQSEIALKQSEERFATIFRQSPVGCGIVSLDGVFLNVNDNLLRMLALPAEKVIGKNTVELGFWKSHAERAEFYKKLRAEGSVQNMEIKFKDATGAEHVGLYFATLVCIGDKECIFGMQLDQTEERELEAKFLQAQKMEALGRLAGGVAHDFNNLLGVIGGYAELLESKLEKTEGLRRYCDKIIDTTQRASGLTRQLLTFSRKEIVRPVPLQPTQALTELTAILPRLIGEDIELLVNLRSTGTVVIDKTHFEQIVFNIVINSRDAMPGGGQILIETEDVLRPVLTATGSVDIGQYVAIRIRDTGVGMDEETRLHAFEPFYTTKEVGRGTGLGLATVYGIVQACQGEITIESSPRMFRSKRARRVGSPRVRRQAPLLAWTLLVVWAACQFWMRPPSVVTDWMGWRQADTMAMAKNFYERPSGLLWPRIDWGGDGPGFVESELALVPFVVSRAFRFVGSVEWPGQLLSLVCTALAGLPRASPAPAVRPGPGARRARFLACQPGHCFFIDRRAT